MEFGWPMRHHVPGAVSVIIVAINLVILTKLCVELANTSF